MEYPVALLAEPSVYCQVRGRVYGSTEPVGKSPIQSVVVGLAIPFQLTVTVSPEWTTDVFTVNVGDVKALLAARRCHEPLLNRRSS